MAKPFHELRERLLRAGVAPRHVRRYLRELSDHLADLTAEEVSAGHSRTEAESAALQRLGTMDDLARAMTSQRQFQSWSARAPWAAFGVAPLLVLAGTYYLALFILWSGWMMFLPGAVTPFGGHVKGPIYGLENLYFQTGRMIYFGAPIFVGWGVGLIAARQRLRITRPALGAVLLALIGCVVRVNASQPASGSAAGHVSLSLGLGPDIGGTLVYALAILSLAALPYLVWQVRQRAAA
jgi:hypothetical protein